MKVTISSSNERIDESRLGRFEENTGRRLPPSYRAFLLEKNGGEPDLDHYPITGMADNPFGEVRAFLGLGAAAEYDDLEWTLTVLNDRLPPDLLPIAYSSGGDMICISLDDRDYGTVYFWDSQTESEPASWMRSGYSNTYFVASDFDEFLRSLNSYEAFAS